MSPKKKQKKQKTGLNDVKQEKQQTSYHSSTKVYIVWVNPIGGIPEMYGIFTTYEKARASFMSYNDSLNIEPRFNIVTYELDYRVNNPQVKFWNPKVKDHIKLLGDI